MPHSHLRFLFLLFLLLLSQISAQVIELTPTTLSSHLSDSKPLLLEFYAHGCRHCEEFVEAYEEISLTLSPSVTVARVDGLTHRLLALRFRIRAFPTFLLVNGGKVFKFEAQARSVQTLVHFVESRGDVHGKPLPHFFGPLGPYWCVVDRALATTDTVWKRVDALQLPAWQVYLLGCGGVVLLLSLFLAVIYFVTKPPPLVKPREHTD